MRAAFVLRCLLLAAMGMAVHADRAVAASGDQGNVAKGHELFEKLCVTCHGVYGRGDGPMAQNLSMKPADLTDSSRLEGRSDEELVKVLRYGSGTRHTPMVISQALNEEALLDVVAYLRTLYVPGEHVSVPAGRDIYESVCWACHGRGGGGDGPAAAMIEGTMPRDFTAPDYHIEGREDEVRAVIELGAEKSIHGSKYMLEWGNKLSPQQIDDVVAFLKTLSDPKSEQEAK